MRLSDNQMKYRNNRNGVLMRFIKIVLSLIFFTMALLSGANNQEFRATWVVTWHHSLSSGTVDERKELIRGILDNHQKANMNAVLWQVRQSGTAYYPSSYEPWGYYVGYSDPGFDPLAYAVEEAHKRGLELHAWFNVFNTSSTISGAPAEKHPEWICRDQSGNSMTSSISVSPGMANVRDYTIDVAMEIVRNYDIDGLHLDYVRWNEYTSSGKSQALARQNEQVETPDGFASPEVIEEMNENQSGRYLYDIEHPYSAGIPAGFSNWEDWWRWSVTEFVRTLHDSIQAVKPWVRLSPAALGKYNWSGWQGYGSVYQDAALWFNEGYVDQLTPMHYHWTSGDGFYDMLQGNAVEAWKPYITEGLADDRLFTVGPGSYILDENNIWYKHKEIIERVRTVDWTDGFQFFSYGSWNKYKYWEEAKSLFFQKKTRVRAAKYLYSGTPNSPAIVLSKVDSLHYNITINPQARDSNNKWFALYRSEDANLDVNTDEIIDIHFGQSAFSVNDSFTGRQDYDSSYTYFATMLDRYWNESAPSNFAASDPIPSFAPQVLSSDPAEGDTVFIAKDIKITFSKTMNTASLANAVSFTPQLAVQSLKWSTDAKTLTISTETMTYATNYMLTISDLATDVNAKALDGKADGGVSESYVLNFVTSAKDIFAPKVDYASVLDEELRFNFDVDDIIDIAFDELLNADSVNANNVQLTAKSGAISYKSKIYTNNGASVVGIQPSAPFDPGKEYTVTLTTGIVDTAGNPLDSAFTVNFKTQTYNYQTRKMVDDFTGSGEWQDPNYSYQTKGVIDIPSTFRCYNSGFYLPGNIIPIQKISGKLHYEWDPTASEFFIREYLKSTSAPAAVIFDTSYTLQCYIFGDGNGAEFRFSIGEGDATQWLTYEVSNWMTIDWIGWKLVEWKLRDPGSVGNWLGNGILDGTRYRIDSFQLTRSSDDAWVGTLYFKNLRLVKKEYAVTLIAGEMTATPQDFELAQNYPNPFNPLTTIAFSLPVAAKTTLTIYDMLGRKIITLMDEHLTAGQYKVVFNAASLASGVYVYELRAGRQVAHKKMMLVK